MPPPCATVPAPISKLCRSTDPAGSGERLTCG